MRVSERANINASSVYGQIEPGRQTPANDTFARYSAIVRHLEAIARLTEEDRHLLVEDLQTNAHWSVGAEIIQPGGALDRPSFVVSGWACRAARIADGRRQLIDLHLPGDLIGYSSRPGEQARAAYVALTEVITVDAKRLLQRATENPELYPGVASAITKLEAEVEQRLIKQIIRIGGLMARERMLDLMIELHHRLCPAGLLSESDFDMPLTQEALGELLGMSTVHVNRTLQQLRREGAFDLRNARVKGLRTSSLSALLAATAWEATT
jgi:CRP-like cAMP-binding protein